MHRTQNLTAPAADTDNEVVVTPADVLRGAATYLEIHGWTQCGYYAAADNGFPPATATGAIGMAAHGTLIDCPTIDGPNLRECRSAYTYLVGYLTDQRLISSASGATIHGWTPATAFGWNDRAGQTAETVIATLRAAADEYDWQHATEDDLETYGENELDNDRVPTREGFLAWLGAR